MTKKTIQRNISKLLLTISILMFFFTNYATANSRHLVNVGNFGLPGIIDLPTALRYPDGELVITQQLHKSLARSGISFQALPRLGVSFRYSGHGRDGGEAYGRINHDRSFDAHISVLNEGKYLPAISVGLRDFIGTGWYSSEYIVGTKSLGNFELTAGLGFGRLAGKNSFSNPLGALFSRFDQRGEDDVGRGGTLGTLNWFQGDTAPFFGANYRLGNKIIVSAEYSPDLMSWESSYLNLKSHWNIGASYQINDFFRLGAQYLHGSHFSATANVTFNPNRPPLLGGKELAPVPMRLRNNKAFPVSKTDKNTIIRVLDADRFKLKAFRDEGNTVKFSVINTKFRSTAQAVGRLASTLQRFTADNIKFAHISFYSENLSIGTYLVDLEKITEQQFNPNSFKHEKVSIRAIDPKLPSIKSDERFTWGLGPYVTHRLFNPDLPLSMETGIEIQSGYQILNGLKISGALRKSVLTNLTDNQRRSNSDLPRVHSDWPL